MEDYQIIEISKEIRDKLKNEFDFEENEINIKLNPIKPYRGKSETKIIFIGQDPTIQNENRRKAISYTLNLDKKGALKKYIEEDICFGLGLTLDNIYATNIFKYFYKEPPASRLYILQAHLKENLALLISELNSFPDTIIITLGEPVLQLLAGTNSFVRNFWDYNQGKEKENPNFLFCLGRDNFLGRDFFPFPHQPSLRKNFYKQHLYQYINFVKKQLDEQDDRI